MVGFEAVNAASNMQTSNDLSDLTTPSAWSADGAATQRGRASRTSHRRAMAIDVAARPMHRVDLAAATR